MNIQITGLHDLKLTPALKDRIHEKFQRLEHHFPHITSTHVTLEVDKKFQQIAKAHLNLAGGGHVSASSESKDMYASIDMLIDKLDEQVIKHKEKLKERGNGHVEGLI